METQVIMKTYEYSDHLNTEHQYTRFIMLPEFLVSGIQMVLHKKAIAQPSHSNTGLFSLVLRCHLQTGQLLTI